ncbi:helix-turn-helix domain-containing protein [Phytohabitans kaempferiae]|uniref:Helix-turn-helix domain-containing protein n=1 Tax=Phytohabitans kaempferiae TaxID=1620943 RepID=A0ABV6LVZ2_9ACTN
MPTKREHFQFSLRAQMLGQRMRSLREGRGLTLKYIASYLGVEFSTLARYERAEWPFRRDHVTALLDVYGVYDEPARAELVELAANAWKINQWEPRYGNNRPTRSNDWVIIDHAWVQARAEELCVYASSLVPELLQTRHYAEAVIRYGDPKANIVDQQVRQLLGRQLVLDEKPPKRLTAVVEESVLSRPVGGQAVLEAQLEHLLRAIERPHVKVRILPTQVGLHDGLDGSFTVCLMQRPYPPAALVEHLGGRAVLEDTDADRYVTTFDKLTERALSEPDSAELILQAAARASEGGLSNRTDRSTAGPEAMAA